MTTMPADDAVHQAQTIERAQSQKGNALVEFALILPVFLALIFGVVTFSLALYNKTVLTMATREGARAGAVYDANNTTDTNITNRAKSAAETACLNSIITFGNGLPIVDDPTFGTLGTARTIIVTAHLEYKGLFWGFIKNSNSQTSYTISAKSIMKLE